MDSEDLMGKWFAQNQEKRDKVFFATKFRNVTKPGGSGITQRSDKEYVKEACAKSLRRLGLQTIDLYSCHRVDGITPIEETVQAMAEPKNEGKIRYLGLSEVSAQTLRRACKVHHMAAVQIEYSPFSMDIEDPNIGLLQTCRKLGVATVAYSPLGRGFLTGAYRSPDDFSRGDFGTHAPRFSKESFPKKLELVSITLQLWQRRRYALRGN